MLITGIEGVVAGVADIEDAERFLRIYGLSEASGHDTARRFEALDGSFVELRRLNDPTLPAGRADRSTIRLTIWGVRDEEELDKIARELGRRGSIESLENGLLVTRDGDGLALGFRVTQRRAYAGRTPAANVTGFAPDRRNQRIDFDHHGPACAMGHIVYWSPDPMTSAAFYVETLGFRITDSYANNAGVFCRAQGHSEHHSIFFLGRPGQTTSFQHLEFSFPDIQEVLTGGSKLLKAGYASRLGPGRHEIGSNWYWYFDSPLGGALELSADIDSADDNWDPRVWPSLREAAGWNTEFKAEKSRS